MFFLLFSQGGEFHFIIKPEARRQSYKPEQSIENSLKVIMKETAEMCDISELVQVIILIIITIINQFLSSFSILKFKPTELLHDSIFKIPSGLW